MRLIFTGLVLLALISFTPVLGKSDSCLDTFQGFKPIEAQVNPTNRNEAYETAIYSWAWYGQCILVGSRHGLFLYDINQPDVPITLAQLKDRYVASIAVNPQTLTIAFNVAQEPTLYFIKPDGNVSTWKAQGQAVIGISYSLDGSLAAVASANIDRDTGMYYDSFVEILNTLQTVVVKAIHDSRALFGNPIFTTDNKHLLVYDFTDTGSDNVVYWDMNTTSKLWDYYDLLSGLKKRTEDDPLAIAMASMSNYILALGGLDGYMDWDEYYGTAVHLWDANMRKRLNQIVVSRRGGSNDEPLTALTLNHDGSILVTGQNNGLVRFWNTKDATELPSHIQLSSPISQLMYDTSDKNLAILSGTKVVIWDTKEGKEVSSFSLVKDS